jgi:hypothetical protein
MTLQEMKSLPLGTVAALAVALFSARAQTPPLAVAPAAVSAAPVPADLSPSAAEVVRLARSGVSDPVVLTYINNSQSLYNLSANNILYLKNAGLSSQILSAMLSHDGAVRSKPGPATYDQRLYAPAKPPNTAAAIPTQPVLPARPAAPAQPQVPASPAPVPTPAPVVTMPSSPQPSVIVEQTPPAPRVEVIPVAPRPNYVWVSGCWSWRGARWVWIGGRWAPRPRPGAIWVDGYWGRHGRGYIWIGGHWH